MTISLATVTADTFRPLVGASLDVTLPSGLAVRGTLLAVKETAPYGPDQRVPFNFSVRAPADPKARPVQGTLKIAHESLGELELFAVPVGQKADGVEWYVVIG